MSEKNIEIINIDNVRNIVKKIHDALNKANFKGVFSMDESCENRLCLNNLNLAIDKLDELQKLVQDLSEKN